MRTNPDSHSRRQLAHNSIRQKLTLGTALATHNWIMLALLVQAGTAAGVRHAEMAGPRRRYATRMVGPWGRYGCSNGWPVVLTEHIFISVMSLVRSMNEGGWWETKFAEKKARLLAHIETARLYLSYSAFVIEKYAQQISHAAWCACARVHPCVTCVQWNVAESMCWC